METPLVAHYNEDGLYVQSQEDFDIDQALDRAQRLHVAGIKLNREQREWLICQGFNPDTLETFDDEQGSLPSDVIEDTEE